ncbi:hypothetical protein [Embleya sp. NPDC050493]|uniref:hypothetical protein n=1 Tax=Embleya sp. NPDC050493 TaxID=3363989 RepID=UPI00378ECBB0
MKDSVSRALFLGAAFLVGMLVLSLVTMGVYQIHRWHPWAPDRHDSRADAGSDPSFSLKKSLRLTGTTLPVEAVDVHFSAGGNMMGTSLSLTYRIPCGAVPAVLAEAKPGAPTAVDDVDNRYVRDFATRHGWRPDIGSTVAYSREGKGFTRMLVQTPAAPGNCSVYIDAFN